MAPQQKNFFADRVPTGKRVPLGVPHANPVLQKKEEAKQMGLRRKSPFLFQCTASPVPGIRDEPPASWQGVMFHYHNEAMKDGFGDERP